MATDQEWERIFHERPWGKYPSEPVIRFVARNFYSVPQRSQVKILDLGCGGGAHTWYLAREGFDTYGIDGSPSAVKQTEALLEKEGLNAHLQVGDVSQLNYPNDFFDVVIDSNTIQHNCWRDILKIHAEIKRVLKKHARCLSIIVNSETTGQAGAETLEINTHIGLQNGFIMPNVLIHLLTPQELDVLTAGYDEINVELTKREDRVRADKIVHYVWSGRKK